MISDYRGFLSLGSYLWSWSKDGNQMGDKTWTRWVSVVKQVYLFDVKQCRKPLRTSDLSVSAEEAMIPNRSHSSTWHPTHAYTVLSIVCWTTDQRVLGGLSVWMCHCSRWSSGYRGHPVGFCSVHNHSITGLNLVQDTCCSSSPAVYLQGFDRT